MQEVDLPFDLNVIVDAVVPIYTALVCIVITYYHVTKLSIKKEESYALKRPSNKVATKDWKELMNGKFIQYEVDGLDDWLIFLGKPYPVRLMAPKMFLRICHEITVKDGKFICIKTYTEGNDKVTKDNLKIAPSAAEAVTEECLNDDGNPAIASAWFDEEKKQLLYEIRPPNDKGVVLKMEREMIDEDTIEVNWYGSQLSTGKTQTMQSFFRRIA